MSYLLVETYGTNDRTVVLDGRTYPLDCLIEDDLGLRWYLAPSFQDMHAPTWARAAAAGAVALATPADGGWRVLSTELFLQVRTEAEHHYWLDYGWGNWAFLPGYPTLMSFERDDRQVTEEVFVSPDDPPRGFVHLHTHTEYSALDGRSRISEIVGQVLRHGQEAVSDTDHGNCSGHPRLQRECEKARIKPIFGMEANFVHDRLRRGRSWWADAEGHEVPDERVSSMTVKERNGALTQHSDAKEVLNGYFHVTLLALDDIGLRNVWAMSTEGFRDGFYGRPRIDWDTLRRHAEGVICLTGCIRGPLAVPIIDGDQAVAQERLGQLLDIFGDRLYLEVMPNAMEEQVKVNRTLASLSTQYGVPLVATVDSHYPTDEARFEHKTWVALSTNADVDDETSLFANDLALYVQGEREVRERLLDSLQPSEIDEAVANTVRIARRCTARIESKVLTPVFSKQGGPERDAERLLDLCLSNWHLTTGKSYTQDEAMARFEREFALIVDKDFCGYFLQVADYVNAAKQAGCRVGPGRGSGGGSLVAYTARITGLDPIEGGLLFERFLTEGREGLPDFDVDFPSTWRDWVQDYITGKYGDEHVVRVGTHLRLRNKGIIQDLFRVMKSRLPETAWRDAEAISAIIGAAESSTAGIGLSWEELWAQEEEVLRGYAEAYPEVMDLAGKMVGLLKSYGKHPAGLVVSETSLVDSLPLRSSEDEGRMITQFEMGDLEKMGYIKFDILTLRTLDTIQETLDLIKVNRGIWIDVDNWKEEYLDPQVWEDLADGHTLGVFQVETSSGTRLMRRLRPGNLNEFADVLTLVRPGPKRSGLQDLYIRRRDGLEEVTYADPRLEPVLSKTYGTMLYQEDIMATCMVLAGYDSAKADEVRSILGKKKVELVVPAGREFVEGCVANGMDRGAAEHLWSQMAEFARYCVSGDTRVHLAGANGAMDGTITAEELYLRLHAEHGPRRAGQGECDGCGRPLRPRATVTICPACRSWRTKFHDDRGLSGLGHYADGRIRPARVLDVLDNGEQETFTVTLADGKSITATGNHRHLSDKGFRRVDDLAIGDRIVVDAGYEPQVHDPRTARLTRGEAQQAGTINGAYGSDNYAFRDGGAAFWSEWRRRTPRVCAQCGETEGRIETAHLDGDHAHNVEGNLAWLCVSCHKAYDYAVNHRRRRWQKGHLTAAVEIVSITPAGVQRVYDVVMDAPHTFVANGIVSHNSFNRAHAYGYSVLAYWTAWLKVHYPVEFFTSVLSTVKAERIPEFVTEARRMGFSILPPDINESRENFTAHGLAVRYGLEAIKGVGVAASRTILAAQPYASFEDFQARSGADRGVQATLARIGALDSLVPNRRGLETLLLREKTGEATACVRKDESVSGPNGLPCTFDWSTEPVPVNPRTQKALKAKPIPKRCTKACRQYLAPPLFDPDSAKPYTEDDIREIEMEVLGLHLSSSVFDRIPEDQRAICIQQAETIEHGPEDSYILAATVAKVRKHTDRTGKDMAFVGLVTERNDLDVVCFGKTWARYKANIRVGSLLVVDVQKNSRGLSLSALLPVI